MARQLATFARLGPLGHLDLEVVAVDQVLARHPEASRGHLLDGRPPEVAVGLRREPVGVLAPLTGVGPAADAVHGYGERLVGLGADRAVGHRSGGETADYRRHRLHLVDRHGRLTVLPEVEHAAQRGQASSLVVDEARVLLEQVVATFACGVLELEDSLRVKEVVLTLPAPPVLPSLLEGAVGALLRIVGEGRGVMSGHLCGQDVQPHATQPTDRPGEARLHHLVAQADGLEDLGTGVRRNGGDAHLGHDLEQALVEGPDHVAAGPLRRHGRWKSVVAGVDHGVDRGEGQVRTDSRCAVSQQQGHVVHLAGVTALDKQADPGAGPLPDEVVVDRTGGQQRWDVGQRRGRTAVADDQDVHTVGDCSRGILPKPFQSMGQALAATGHFVAAVQDAGGDAARATVSVDSHEGGQLGLCDDRMGQVDLSAAGGLRE